MPNPKYAAYRSAAPYFDLIRKALGALVDGEHFFDIVTDDTIYEVLYDVPGWPRVIMGRTDLMRAFKSYVENVALESADRAHGRWRLLRHRLVALRVRTHLPLQRSDVCFRRVRTWSATGVRRRRHHDHALYFGNSVCCQKVRITLCEKGLDWESVKVDLFRSEQYDPKYLKLNPKGVVPTLVHDGNPVIESTLICEYLDDTFPHPRLIPAHPGQRARMQLGSKAVDEGFHEGVTEISFSAMFRERMKTMPADLREIRFRNIGDPRRRDRFKSTYELGVQSPFVLYAIAAYERAFKTLEETLAEGGPWIVGAELTLADINLMPYVARLEYLGLLGVWTDGRPHIGQWWARARDWPSFNSGLYCKMTEAELTEMRTHGPKIRGDVANLLAELRRAESKPIKRSGA